MLFVEAKSRDAAFYFSVEEYFMHHSNANMPVMMVWQTDKCVMLGNYQVANAEINLSYAQKNKVQVVRRPSGGGTIFTDGGTLLYTIIIPKINGQDAHEEIRRKFANSVVDALYEVGITAKVEGRNDILLDGKKITGIAQHVNNSHVCTHGSILYDTDLHMLSEILNVDEEKIRSKAIRSVRSRVTNIKDYMATAHSTQVFKELFEQNLLKNQNAQKYTLNSNDLEVINEIYNEKFGNPTWVFEKSPKFTYYNSKRFTEGKIEVYMDIVNGSVASCRIRGDFLGTVPIHGLEKLLEKKSFTHQTLSNALGETPLIPYLGAITKEQLLLCIFE